MTGTTSRCIFRNSLCVADVDDSQSIYIPATAYLRFSVLDAP